MWNKKCENNTIQMTKTKRKTKRKHFILYKITLIESLAHFVIEMDTILWSSFSFLSLSHSFSHTITLYLCVPLTFFLFKLSLSIRMKMAGKRYLIRRSYSLCIDQYRSVYINQYCQINNEPIEIIKCLIC